MTSERPVITLVEWAAQVGVHRQQAAVWYDAGRLPGAYRSPEAPRGIILVPAQTPRPVDGRTLRYAAGESVDGEVLVGSGTS